MLCPLQYTATTSLSLPQHQGSLTPRGLSGVKYGGEVKFLYLQLM